MSVVTLLSALVIVARFPFGSYPNIVVWLSGSVTVAGMQGLRAPISSTTVPFLTTLLLDPSPVGGPVNPRYMLWQEVQQLVYVLLLQLCEATC